MKKQLLFVFATLLPILASAQTKVEIDDIWYNLYEDIQQAEVTHKGNSFNEYKNEYSGSITIPTTVTYGGVNYSVTSIGSEAFRDCGSLTNITIPEGVMSIGSDAFLCCCSLKSIILPESVTSIGEWAFSCCETLTTITIPEGVTSIGESAFHSCSALYSITLPESVTSIGEYAFYWCISLTAITIPEGVTSIGEYAFYDCSSLTDITIPENSQLTSIGKDAFGNCSSLTAITLPKGVTSIENDAFYDCSSLTAITIPENSQLTSIGSWAFENCNSLTAINIPEGVTSIGEWAFRNCSSLTAITIPENSQLTSIGEGAFEDTAWYDNQPDGVVYAGTVLYRYKGTMPENTSIEIKEGTKSIAQYAFYRCSGLTAINIPEGVTSIGEGAFEDCSSLTSTTLPESVTSIESSAFCSCNNLTTITIPEGVTSIGSWAFAACSSLTAITIPEGVTSIGEKAFYNCASLTTITSKATTPPTVGSPETFYNVDKSIPVYVPASSVEAYQSAKYWREFTNIQRISSGTCGDNLTWRLTEEYKLIIEGTGEMYDYSSDSQPWYAYKEFIQTVTLSEGVTNIGDYAFYDCDNLSTVSIPEGVTSIGKSAFYDCSSLTDINIPEGVMSIGDQAFQGSSVSGDLTIPYSCKYIGISAFLGTKITSLDFPVIGILYDNNLLVINDFAFADCKSLESANLHIPVYHIGKNPFMRCDNLVEITGVSYGVFTDDKRTQGNIIIDGCLYSFIEESGDANLELICCPAGKDSYASPNSSGYLLSSLGDYAFHGCKKITDLDIPGTVSKIGDYSLALCGSHDFNDNTYRKVIIHEGVTEFGENIFAWHGDNWDVYLYGSTEIKDLYISFQLHKFGNLHILFGTKSEFIENNPSMEYWFNVIDDVGRKTTELTVSSAGYATLYLDYNAAIPESMEVYIASSVEGDRLKMTQITDVLPAGTGVIVRATKGDYTFAEIEGEYTAIEGNLLVGTTTNTYITALSGYKYYVLSQQDGVVGMYRAKIKDNGTFLNNANKAYLALYVGDLGIFDEEVNTDEEGGQLSNRLRFDFSGTTDIEQTTVNGQQTTIIYDLQGRKVTDAEGLKGIYIVNGKKTIIK